MNQPDTPGEPLMPQLRFPAALLVSTAALAAAIPATAVRRSSPTADSVYAMQPRIFEIDATAAPARIVRAIDVTRTGRPAQKLDLEGIAADGEGGF
jgi:hypothetical protein